MQSVMQNFGQNDLRGLALRAIQMLSGKPEIEPPITHVTPMGNPRPNIIGTPNQGPIGGGSFVHPYEEQSPIKYITPNNGPNVPEILSLFGNPDYTGQHGFPEKPTGLGGLRPLGGISANPSNQEQNDPGAISLEQMFGENGLDYIDLLVELLSDKQKRNAMNNPWGLGN